MQSRRRTQSMFRVPASSWAHARWKSSSSRKGEQTELKISTTNDKNRHHHQSYNVRCFIRNTKTRQRNFESMEINKTRSHLVFRSHPVSLLTINQFICCYKKKTPFGLFHFKNKKKQNSILITRLWFKSFFRFSFRSAMLKIKISETTHSASCARNRYRTTIWFSSSLRSSILAQF